MWLLNQVWNLWKNPDKKLSLNKKSRKLSNVGKLNVYFELLKILDNSFIKIHRDDLFKRFYAYEKTSNLINLYSNSKKYDRKNKKFRKKR